MLYEVITRERYKIFGQRYNIFVRPGLLAPLSCGSGYLNRKLTGPLPARIYANEGVAQMLFFESDEICDTSYRDRGGKYQGQRGVTLPKI